MGLGSGSETETEKERKGWVQGYYYNNNNNISNNLAAPLHAGLTVDVTSASAFEAALQIVEFVKGLEIERDTELCSSRGGSAATTPDESVESEREWGVLGLSGREGVHTPF
jgi:hypothetical protein